MSNKTGCPPIPDVEQKFESIKSSLAGLGGNQKCKSVLDTATESGMTKVDAVTVVASLFAVGVNSTSVTKSQNDFKETLEKEGCSDIFMNINEQMNSSQNILCELNNSTSKTTLIGSANANISIAQGAPTENQSMTRRAALEKLSPPIAPLRPGIVAGSVITARDVEVYQLGLQNYNEALVIQRDTISSIMGDVSIKNSQFKNTASVDMTAVTTMNSSSTTKLVEEYKKVVKNTATNELINKSGLGADSDNIKAVVASKLSDKTSSITNNIRTSLMDVKLVGDASAGFQLIFYGSLKIENVIFDSHAQTRLITQSIMSSATNMGKTIALDILSDGATLIDSEKVSTGQEELMKELFAGQLELSKANAEGAKAMLDGATGFLTNILGMVILIPLIIGVVILLFFPQIANIIAPGPLKYVLAAVLIYFITARIIGLWPFGKSEENSLHYDAARSEHLNYQHVVDEKPSRGGELMYTYENLGVPGWKWDDH